MYSESLLRQWTGQALATSPYGNDNFPPSLYYRFLRVAAQHIKPTLSVELGVSGGGGILHLAMGWPQGTVVGVDVENDHPENIEYILSKYPNVHFLVGDSIDMAGDVYDEFGPVDILFIDTIHTEVRTWDELEAWGPYLSKRAIVCFDDLLRAEMGSFWDDLAEPKVRLDMLHDIAEGGFGVKWYEH